MFGKIYNPQGMNKIQITPYLNEDAYTVSE